MPAPEVRLGADRFVTEAEGRTTRHSFSFGDHYDPTNTGLGLLVCHNDDLVTAGNGYDDHPHRDLEIVTWVLAGGLRHHDTEGHDALVTPGVVQRLSAGSGVVHAEHAAGPEPVHFLQMWVLPDEPGTPPDYALADCRDGLATGGWVTITSGRRTHGDRTALRIGSSGAACHVARLRAGTSLALPEAPDLHLFVATGAVDLEGAGPLHAGDAARISGGGQQVRARTAAEVVVWELHPR